MYAVIETGGKQYKVQKGDTVQVELLPEDFGEKKTFSDILLVGEGAQVQVGTPYVKGASVLVEVVAVEKGEKLYPFHKKRRQQFKRKIGHRQIYSRLLITAVNGDKKETLSAQEREQIMKRVGFALRDARVEKEPVEKVKRSSKTVRAKEKSPKAAVKKRAPKKKTGKTAKKKTRKTPRNKTAK